MLNKNIKKSVFLVSRVILKLANLERVTLSQLLL
jgi:hypothetical protein